VAVYVQLTHQSPPTSLTNNPNIAPNLAAFQQLGGHKNHTAQGVQYQH